MEVSSLLDYFYGLFDDVTSDLIVCLNFLISQ